MKDLFSYQQWFLVTILTTLHRVVTSEAGFACLSNPCVNGICIDDLNSKYTCYCIDGFTGVQCQTNWNECWSSPCLNGGSCIDGIASYNCTCVEGYSGENCELDTNECISNPCHNFGKCVDVHNGYECQCLPGYLGVNCETDLAVCNTTTSGVRCHNNGLCIDGPGLTYTCQCQPGWAGTLCEDNVNECLSSPCQNGGVCLDLHASYICACTFGYTGQNCETELELCDLNLCDNGALCLSEDDVRVCYCVPDYHGDKCQYQYDECQLKGRCLNGGTCIDGVDTYTCSCPAPTTGTNCECYRQNDDEYDCNSTSSLYTFSYDTSEDHETTLRDYSTTSTLHSSTITASFPSSWPSTGPFGKTQTQGTADTFASVTEPIRLEATTSGPATLAVTLTEEAVEEATLFVKTTARIGVTMPFSNRESNGNTETVTSILDTTYDTSREDFTLSSLPEGVTTTFVSHDNQTVAEQADDTKSTDVTSCDNEYTVTKLFTDVTSTFKHCHNITCFNGGVCNETSYGSKCICEFGWDGPSCEYRNSINVVAFTGKSYLMHHLTNNTSIIVALKLKTLSSLGVLFYVQVTSNMYMYLYVQDGFLKFQFSCGVQTMVFSETKFRVNNGYETSVFATVTFSVMPDEEGECSSALKVNSTVAMSGEQTTAVEQKLSTLPLLVIGGFPKYMVQQLDVPVTEGIIGCIHSLQIDGVDRDLYADAFDRCEISECSSLACLSNPCHQSATCIEEGHSWNCICPSGFVGKLCNVSICDNNPCQFGATCVHYPINGFLCLCPLGKHGLYCEQDLEISQPTFSSTIRGFSSFVAYRLPINSVLDTFELRLKFIPETMEQISLMVFIGQEDPRSLNSDHLSLSFIKGYIALTWNLGAGPRRIFTPRPIMKKGKKMHSITIGRTGTRAWLFVDGFKNITGRSLGRYSQLNVTPIIYVGGHESFNFVNLPHDLPLHSGFAGCIYDMELHTSHIVLGLQKTHPITGRSVAQCGTSECTNFTCQHGGVCLQYGAAHSCLCPDGWFGAVCAQRYNLCDSNYHKCSAGSTCVPLAQTYECDCPVGQTGKYCEITENQLSDIQFSGQRSYLLFNLGKSFHTKEFTIEFEVKPLIDKSLILYAVEPQSSFFSSILMKGGILEFRILTFGNGKASEIEENIISVKSGTIISLGEWTRIRAGRFGQKLYLTVNAVTNSRVMPPDNNIMLNNISFYFGGTENLANVEDSVTSGLPVSYKGCIRKLSINYKHMVLNTNTIISGRNIADCDGTPCGTDVCANGGSCWLNTTLEPYCMCPQEYQGERCEHQVSCGLVPCRNNGQCVLDNEHLICHCPLGWIGPFCEKEMPSVTPFFKGNSYIIIDTKTREINKRQFTGDNLKGNYYIYIKFSTTEDDGLLLWNTRADNYFGIGINGGKLKIGWSVNNSINELPIDSPVTINNGIWHSVVFKYNGTSITLIIDGEEIYVKGSFTKEMLTVDNLFYIGGFPNQNVFNETFGIFSSNFNGCVEEFAWNQQMVINNFKRYRGENVGSCFENKG